MWRTKHVAFVTSESTICQLCRYVSGADTQHHLGLLLFSVVSLSWDFERDQITCHPSTSWSSKPRDFDDYSENISLLKMTSFFFSALSLSVVTLAFELVCNETVLFFSVCGHLLVSAVYQIPRSFIHRAHHTTFPFKRYFLNCVVKSRITW